MSQSKVRTDLDSVSAEVLVPFGDGFIALSIDAFQNATQRGRELCGGGSERPLAEIDVLDAYGMEQRTGIPSSWFLEQARKRKIPHLRAGKYVRFEFNQVIDLLQQTRHADNMSFYKEKQPATQGDASGVARLLPKSALSKR